MKQFVLGLTLAALLFIPFAGADAGPVDREWQKILAKNGTLYDAYLRLADIMKNGKPSHPDTVKLPKGLAKANYNNMFYPQNYPLVRA